MPEDKLATAVCALGVNFEAYCSWRQGCLGCTVPLGEEDWGRQTIVMPSCQSGSSNCSGTTGLGTTIFLDDTTDPWLKTQYFFLVENLNIFDTFWKQQVDHLAHAPFECDSFAYPSPWATDRVSDTQKNKVCCFVLNMHIYCIYILAINVYIYIAEKVLVCWSCVNAVLRGSTPGLRRDNRCGFLADVISHTSHNMKSKFLINFDQFVSISTSKLEGESTPPHPILLESTIYRDTTSSCKQCICIALGEQLKSE